MQTYSLKNLINHLNLPPHTSSINFLQNIKSTKVKQYTVNYLFIPKTNNYLLIYTYNHFKTFSSPITPYLTYFDTLQQLIDSI